MRRKSIILSLVLSVFFLGFSGIANAITLAERDELNNATPGTSKVGLGTLLRSSGAVGLEFLTTDDTSISLLVEPSGDTGYVRKYTGANDEGTNLQDGSVGQIVTFALTVDGGGTWIITPDTSSGFNTITFADITDNATLKFVNSTIGWVVIGSADKSSGPVLADPLAPFN